MTRDDVYFVLKAVIAGAVLILIAGIVFMGGPAKACLAPVVRETAFATAVLSGLGLTAIKLSIRHWPVDPSKALMASRRQILWQRRTSSNVGIGIAGMIITQIVLWSVFPSTACALFTSFYGFPSRDPVFVAAEASLAVSILGYFGGG